MNENTNAIEVKEISKKFKIYGDKSHTFKERILFSKRNQYRQNVVLDNVSFSVKKGEAIGLIGHNGCGKSTTLKLLSRIMYPDKGTIEMNGKVSSLIELGAGFHPDMTGIENIYINASIFGLKRREIDERLEDIIRFSELENFIHSPVRTYSSGMYMRLAFSIVINVDASILLVDEILAVGDANFQRKCFDRLLEIKEQGTSIVIVSHNMDQVKKICDRVLWLEDGHIREEGEAKVVCDDYLYAMDNAAYERKRAEQGMDKGDDPDSNPYNPALITPQCSHYVKRVGNMLARFTSVTMVNRDGDLCQSFRFGEPMCLRFGIQSYEEEKRLFNIVFVITQKDGTRCTMFETYHKFGRYLREEELREAEFTIDHLMLGSGEYYLDAVLWDAHVNMMDNNIRLIDFSVVTPDANGIGLLAMDMQWKTAGGQD